MQWRGKDRGVYRLNWNVCDLKCRKTTTVSFKDKEKKRRIVIGGITIVTKDEIVI